MSYLLGMKSYTYLALGDAYTAGVSVATTESFPFQVVQLLRHRYPIFSAPEVIAGRGWGTQELSAQIEATRLLPAYDFVTLQIGVNNQIRGNSPDEFALFFESLLLQAIHLAGNRTERVCVLSVPDWSATPFGQSRLLSHPDTVDIPGRIDQYNQRKKEACARYDVRFLDITSDTRLKYADTHFHSEDGLHPSRLTYQHWAEQVYRVAENILLKEIQQTKN
jgi:lysophospholipase L1-like esterase